MQIKLKTETLNIFWTEFIYSGGKIELQPYHRL